MTGANFKILLIVGAIATIATAWKLNKASKKITATEDKVKATVDKVTHNPTVQRIEKDVADWFKKAGINV
jgi:hypothetical protein